MQTGFGWIEINGVRYDHDVIIHADGTVNKRKKKASKALKGEYGHTPLSRAELDFLSDEKPRKVFIGTGQDGDLPVTPDATAFLSRYETVTAPTPELLTLIGQEKERFVAILHVTC
ncbi:MAG: MTH938/NDUFAF3 family protein [Methanoregula sp.]|nr:MAG: MTH938/NDUFAF3 family protein [Methanoregula sp.]